MWPITGSVTTDELTTLNIFIGVGVGFYGGGGGGVLVHGIDGTVLGDHLFLMEIYNCRFFRF